MAMLKTFPSGTILTLSILLYSGILKAASLIPNRYDPSTLTERMYNYPNPDMIKALEFIENLRQNSEDTSLPDYDERGILRPVQEALLRKFEEDNEENEQPDTNRESLDGGRADWAKLLLKTLMQAESNAEANDNAYSPQPQETDGNLQDYDGLLVESGRRQDVPRKYRVAFPGDSYRINPYKRTNEIIEEEYTPQSLATLESAFRELGRHTEPSRQQERLQEEHFGKDEEDDTSRDSEFAYEDVAEGEDSVEMKNRHQHKEVQFEDEETELDRDSERAGINARNSLDEPDSQERGRMEKDKAADLMLQYYKRLQDRMDEEQARRELETDRNGEAPSRQLRGSQGDLEPRLMDQLVELSNRLQIAPDDLLQIVQGAERRKQAGPGSSDREEQRLRESVTREQGAAGSSLDSLSPEDILNILGLDDGHLLQQPPRNRPPPAPPGPAAVSPFERFPGLGSSEGTGRGGEQLARYLYRLLAAGSAPVGGRRPEAGGGGGGSREPLSDLLQGVNPRTAAEMLALISQLPGLAGSDDRAARAQQDGGDPSLMIHKLAELLNQQRDNRDGSVKELNRGMLALPD
ncbi:secretogranin-2-like [Chiloscyllium plagiosum]|uniref:secretogranin-2-like n=1 Tax=Chiloscyllium plagiosum TaxID=36176 RepID=UPI001CB7DCDB|nr:secretogranin-2-like [Chiloscyllium plagiosum]